MTNICRTFHLAFKGMDADEIYDVMMSLLLRAALKYDPLYSEKVARVIEVIKNSELIGRTFTINDLNNHLDFDGARFVRVLCRNGFLEPLPEDGKPRRYRRKADAWRKRLTKFLHAGPVGFTYYLQMWFRYYLEMHIESAMGELSPDDKHTGTDRSQSDDGVALLAGPHPITVRLVMCSRAHYHWRARRLRSSGRTRNPGQPPAPIDTTSQVVPQAGRT